MSLLFAALALDALFSSATLAGSHTGALVIDASSAKVVYARHADDAFIPASTIKLIVGSVALDRLGEGFTYTTKLTTDGDALYVEGGGDPLLAQKDVDDAAATVAALDLHAFAGGLHADVRRYQNASRYPDGWQIDDLAYDYGAPVSALNFNENVVHLAVTGNANPTDPPTIAFTPDIAPPCLQTRVDAGITEPFLSIAADERGNAGYGLWDCTVVNGSFTPGKTETFDASVLQPELFALQAFQRAFAAHGITVTVPAYPAYLTDANGRVLWTHQSPPLSTLLADMWQPSDNFLAESLLDEIGLTGGSNRFDTRGQGIDVETNWLRGIGVDPTTLTIVDGSGMSAYDRVTPRALVAILAHDWNGPHRGTVLAALPMAGKSGTLEDAFKNTPLAGKVIAKTGTSNHTRTLAGYLSTPHGTYIFALLVNDWMDRGPGSAARLRAFQQAFLTRIRDGASGV